MGILDSLFEKKYCDICGNEIGLLGQKKVADGVVCSKCTSKLSPYFTERKKSTVQDIKDQLQYREENKQRLADFNPDYVVDGNGKQVRVDQNMGCFIVYDGENWMNSNPDLIPLEDVENCIVEIHEREEELYDKDENGHRVPREPKEFKYEYTFNVTIDLNHPYISRICYEMTNFAHRPQSPYEDLFTYNVQEAEALYRILMNRAFAVNYNRFRYHEPIRRPEPVPAPAPQPKKPVQPRPAERPRFDARKPQEHAPAVGMHTNPSNRTPQPQANRPQSQGAPHGQPNGSQAHAAQPQQNGMHAQAQPQQNGPQTQSRPEGNRGPQQGNNGRPEGSGFKK